MSKKHRIIFACGGLLAITLTLVLAGRLLLGEDDTKAEKTIEALGGEVARNPSVPGKPIISVYLRNTQVTDARLKELAGLQSLQTLYLDGTNVTDTGLKELAGLKSLQHLNLAGTKVTDAGLKELAGLKSLQGLSLQTTLVTDVGLKELAGLKSVQLLNLDGTKVTDAGVEELRKALPSCTIIH